MCYVDLGREGILLLLFWELYIHNKYSSDHLIVKPRFSSMWLFKSLKDRSSESVHMGPYNACHSFHCDTHARTAEFRVALPVSWRLTMQSIERWAALQSVLVNTLPGSRSG